MFLQPNSFWTRYPRMRSGKIASHAAWPSRDHSPLAGHAVASGSWNQPHTLGWTIQTARASRPSCVGLNMEWLWKD